MLPESGEEKYNLRRDDKIYRKRVNKFIKNLYGGKERNSNKRDKKICGKIRIYDSRKKNDFHVSCFLILERNVYDNVYDKYIRSFN